MLADEKLVLPAAVVGVLVVRVVPPERAPRRRAGLRRLPHQRVEVREKAIAVLDDAARHLLGPLAEGPRLLVRRVDHRVVAEERAQRPDLQPAREQLGRRVPVEAAHVHPVERDAGHPEPEQHPDAEPEVLPRRRVVARPHGGVALLAREAGPRQHERPAVREARAQAFVRRLRHIVAVEVTQPLEVAARADDLFGEGLAPHGGLVHVVPDAVHALRDVVGGMATPPVARLRPAEVGEVGAPRPDGADVDLAIGVAQEVVAVEPLLRDGIPSLGVLFHARVHDDDGLEAHLAEVGQQGVGIGEALGVPREDAVAIHVVDVEVEHVGRDLFPAKGLGEGTDLGLGVVAPPALLVAERPRRREVHPPCHGCVLLDDGGGRRAAEDDEVERAAGRRDAPRPMVARAETERALVRIVEIKPVEGPAPPDEHERDALVDRIGVVAVSRDIAVPHRPRTAPLVHVAGLLSEPEELVVFQREPHAHLVSVPPDAEPWVGREAADLQLTLVAQTDR